MDKELELYGVVEDVMPIKKGTSGKKAWKKKIFILQPDNKKLKDKICFSIWGNKIDEIDVENGLAVSVFFKLSGFKHHNKWYTEANAQKVTYDTELPSNENGNKKLNLDGKVLKVSDIRTGKRRHKTWRRQQLILETFGLFEKQICFNIWNDNIDKLQFDKDDYINVVFSISSQKYNDSWYTHLNVLDIGESKTKIIKLSDLL